MTIQEKEQQLIGFLVLTPSYIPEALKKLISDNFYDEKSKKIYQIIADRFNQGFEIDEAILADQSGESQAIGKMVSNNTLTSASFLQFLHDIRSHAESRRLLNLSSRLSKAVKENNREEIEDIKQQIIAEQKTIIEPQNLSDLTIEYFEKYQSPQEKGILTGIPKLDFLTDGFHKGDFITIMARSGRGKSCLSLQLALHALKQQKKVLFLSLEMLPDQLIDRLIAMQGNFSAHKIRRREIPLKNIDGSLVEIRKLPLKIMFSADLTSIDVFTLGYAQKVTDGLDMIILDYLGRLNDKFNRSEEERLTKMCRNLKNCALKLQVPLISPVQIDKLSAKSGASPELEDAKGSTSIGHESDLSLAIVRHDLGKPESKLYITKNRHGNCSDINLYFNLKNLIFNEIVKEQENEQQPIQQNNRKPYFQD